MERKGWWSDYYDKSFCNGVTYYRVPIVFRPDSNRGHRQFVFPYNNSSDKCKMVGITKSPYYHGPTYNLCGSYFRNKRLWYMHRFYDVCDMPKGKFKSAYMSECDYNYAVNLKSFDEYNDEHKNELKKGFVSKKETKPKK